ncbi:MAG: hypothetical protein ACRCW0_02045 [Clostridium sp.]
MDKEIRNLVEEIEYKVLTNGISLEKSLKEAHRKLRRWKCKNKRRRSKKI